MKWWVLAFVAILPGLRSETWGTQAVPAPAMVGFGLERPVAQVSYRFTVLPDGSGTYRATYPASAPASPAEVVEIPLRLHAGTARKIYAQAQATLPLHGNCETRAKNIAQTGIKTLTVTSGGVATVCSWNYSDKTNVAALQEEFLAMAATLETGRRLKMEQRFDRLGLDREMAFLTDEVKEGRAQGLENIAPVLQGIVDDTSLLERVRSSATKLLQMSMVER